MLEHACGDDPQADAKSHALVLTSWQAFNILRRILSLFFVQVSGS